VGHPGGEIALNRQLAEAERDELGRVVLDLSTFNDPFGGASSQPSAFTRDPQGGIGGPFGITEAAFAQEFTDRQTEVDAFIEENRSLFFDETGNQIREFGADPLQRGVLVDAAVTDPDEVNARVTELLAQPGGIADSFGVDSVEYRLFFDQTLHGLTGSLSPAQIDATFTFANLGDIPLIEFIEAGQSRPASTISGLERRNEAEGLGFGTDRFGVPGGSSRNVLTGGRLSVPGQIGSLEEEPGLGETPTPGVEPGQDLGGEPRRPGSTLGDTSTRTTGSRGRGIDLTQSRQLGGSRVGGATAPRSPSGPAPTAGLFGSGGGSGAFELDPLLDPRSTFLRSLL
jgi:hypothetical protein